MKRRIPAKENTGGTSPTSDECNSFSSSPSSPTLLVCLVTFRICNALLLRTWFVPDEFWQGPEVAHNLVYGYGYLTWEWKEGLRGFTFPLMFAAAIKILQIIGLDSVNAIILAPRLIQAVLAGFGDFFLFKLSGKIFGQQSAKWSLFCNLISWFTFYSITRTLTNSTETVLTTIAFYYWPWNFKTSKDTNSNIVLALLFAALSCLIRPTSAIIWIPLALDFFIKSKKRISFIFINVLPIGALALVWSICVDSWFYGRLTIVQLNFVMFNVVKDMGTFYGSHPWHWYFTQGFPAIIFTHFPLCLAGVYYSKERQRLPVMLIAWVITVYSLLGHKEFRFIFPVLPLCMCYSGYCMSMLVTEHTQSKNTEKIKCNWLVAVVLFLCITNIPVALYTSTVHQRGVMDVINNVHIQSQEKPCSVMFLMPCHSTPYYSHVHRNISMRFLECPPIDKPGYNYDEADRFFLNPLDWLENEYSPHLDAERKRLPTHLIFFDVLFEKIEEFLTRHEYVECARFFHTHFPEGRIGKKVVIFCQKYRSGH